MHLSQSPPPADRQLVRRALISVSDKSGLTTFAQRLAALGIEIISTGGTARALRDAGLRITDVAEVTGFPEILGGRVKTLHPAVHGGILARRDEPNDRSQLGEHSIDPIDLVVVNLYPFANATANADTDDSTAAENIDIGGPTMVRAAAKNWFFVGVVTEPTQYDAIADELEANEVQLSMATRRALARSAFEHTATYDRTIVAYLDRGFVQATEAALPERLEIQLPRAQEMRYGENPHQKAALYGNPERFIEKLHGKELSFNNLLDLSAAIGLIREFEDAPPTVAILKHTNPCGVATGGDLRAAYEKAFATDRQSPFGGIVVANRPLNLEAAEVIDAVFTEIIIAPDFEPGVLNFLEQKVNRRLIRLLPGPHAPSLDVRSAVGGVLVQEVDRPIGDVATLRGSCTVVTDRKPSDAEWADLDFAWRVCKHVKSNAIVYARDGATLGVGAGQMSRIDASEIAVAKAQKSELTLERSAVASDAFFPFADGLIAAAAAGATSVIQPGGSIRDDEVIAAANERGMTMVFTGQRHFRH